MRVGGIQSGEGCTHCTERSNQHLDRLAHHFPPPVCCILAPTCVWAQETLTILFSRFTYTNNPSLISRSDGILIVPYHGHQSNKGDNYKRRCHSTLRHALDKMLARDLSCLKPITLCKPACFCECSRVENHRRNLSC